MWIFGPFTGLLESYEKNVRKYFRNEKMFSEQLRMDILRGLLILKSA